VRVSYAINARLAGGGIGNTAYHAVKAIDERGWLHRLFVSSSETHEFARSDVRSMGLFGRTLKRAANYDASQRLNQWSDRLFDRWSARQIDACDIYHGWQNHALATLRAAQRRGASTIVERGGSHILKTQALLQEEYGRWGWREPELRPEIVERALREFEAANFVLVQSQYNLDSFVEQGYPSSKLILTPLGVDTQRFRPRAQPRRESQPFRALFMGQVSLRKGIQYLLPAWRQAALPNAELVVVGEIKADTARVIREYESDQTIRWLGHVSEPLSVYQSADVFVFPSIDEGSALVTYEAMACGLPSIVTPNAGALARGGVDGFVVPLRDVNAIAEKLCWLHEHDDARLAMGRAARAYIEPKTWKRYGERLLQSYHQVCA